MRARDLMRTDVVTVHPDMPLKEVAEVLTDRRIGGVPVIDGEKHVVGILSESDFLVKYEHAQRGGSDQGLLGRLAHVVAPDRASEARVAGDLMKARVITASPDADLRQLVHMMIAHRIHRIPIVEGDRLVGIVTRADFLRTLIRDDDAISEEARSRLTHDLWIDPRDLQIRTRQGVVTVEGEVDMKSDVATVERWLLSIPGVVAVDVQNLRYRTDDRRLKVGAPLG